MNDFFSNNISIFLNAYGFLLGAHKAPKVMKRVLRTPRALDLVRPALF